MLSSGYTRAAEYLWGSDDEAPMPKAHPIPKFQPAGSAQMLGRASLHPPLKQLRASAVSAPVGKGIEKAIAADPRLHQPAPQAFRLPVPATVHELVAPQPPVVSAHPKPAKGCNRILLGIRSPLNEGTPWPKPRVSNGFDNVGDGAPWRSIAVAQYNKKPWPMWGRCVPTSATGLVLPWWQAGSCDMPSKRQSE